MAQPQQNITLSAPGYFGLNLEDAPIDMDQRYCLQADNAVIDRFGRLGARKGFDPLLQAMPDTAAKVESIGQVIDGNTKRIIAGVSTAGGNFIWELENVNTGSPSATQITLPVGFTLPTANVQIIDFAGYGVILSGAEVLILRNGSLSVISDGTDGAGAGFIPPQDISGPLLNTLDFSTGTAAYGRLWLSGGSGGEETIYYSSLQNPFQWYDGKDAPTNNFNTGGVIDVFEAWPLGKDRIVDIAGHNNMLVVFGRNSILVYGNPQGDPAAEGGIYLADTIKNIGLVDKDALASDGRDLLFMDDTGLRSLGRTIQEQSAAIGDLTRTVRTELTREMSKAVLAGGVELVYDPTESFVLIVFRGSNDVWVADTRMPMQDGAYRITRWPGAPINCGFYDDATEKLLLGCSDFVPVAEYTGTVDFSDKIYNFKYQSPILSFGDPVRSKFVKQIDYLVVSGQSEANATGTWQYVGLRPYEKNRYITLAGGLASYYGPFSGYLYNQALYGQGEEVVRSYKLNADGSGENVIVKFASEVNNSICSLQQINIQALLGRIT